MRGLIVVIAAWSIAGCTSRNPGLQLGDATPDSLPLIDGGADQRAFDARRIDGPPTDAAATDAVTAPDVTSDTGGLLDGPPVDQQPADTTAFDSSPCPDEDQDGQTTCAGDCDDQDPENFSGNPEICGDGQDNNCSNTADEGCGGIGTFVSSQAGNDNNPGTKALPVASIGEGIAHAVQLGAPRTVYIAGGVYQEKVTLVEKVSLLGGYHCDLITCDWARDPATYRTTIRAQDEEGLLAPATITKATRLDGLRIIGQAGGSSTNFGRRALTLDGGTPTITNNRIEGPDVSGSNTRTVALSILAPSVDQSGALIDGNTIIGGDASHTSLGIDMRHDQWPPPNPTVATITNNTIRGGDAQRTRGITAWTSGPGTLIEGNRITGGSSSGSGGSWGIEIGGTATINANRINLDRTQVGVCAAGSTLCGGIASESSTSKITNNIVIGTRGPYTTALLLGEFEVPAGTVVVNGNYLDGGGSQFSAASTASAAIVLRIGSCTTCGFNGFAGRIRNNILVGGMGGNCYGIYEDPAVGRTMHPEALDNNDLYCQPGALRNVVLYHLESGSSASDLTTPAEIAQQVPTSTAPPSANLAENPLIDSSYHLSVTPLSPCIDQGTPNEAPPRDFEGDTRPRGLGVDIGPDEAR